MVDAVAVMCVLVRWTVVVDDGRTLSEGFERVGFFVWFREEELRGFEREGFEDEYYVEERAAAQPRDDACGAEGLV